MEKYLFFKTAASDSVAFPVSRLVTMGTVGDGASLIVTFIAAFEGGDGLAEVEVDVTITDNKGRIVMQAIADEIRYGKGPFITVADDAAGEYLHTNITAVGAITDFA
jgi:hypothetical protein